VLVRPSGKELVVIVIAGLIVIESDFVTETWVGEALSVTLTVKLDVPLALGVPDITPVEA
jgi:hypothetical protein